MKNSPFFLLLIVFSATALADDKPANTKTPSLLDLKSQVSEPLRKQEKDRKAQDKVKVPPAKQAAGVPQPPCDPTHGDCLKKHPEYLDKMKMPNVPAVVPPVTGGDIRK